MKSKTPKSINVVTDYLGDLYTPKFLKVVPSAVKLLRNFKKKYPFEAIAFSGSSGAGLAFPISYLLKVPLIHVKKSTRSSHYSGKIEGAIPVKSYIIIDDFIESGTTMRRIISSIAKETDAKPIGIFLYSSIDWNSGTEFMKIPIHYIK